MADSEEDFECWLNSKLRALNTDEGVFGTYIKGILEGEETLDDKTEALEGILSEITEEDIPKHCREILERWQKISQALNSNNKSQPEEDVEVKLVRLLESQSLPTVAPKSYTEEERKIREAILAQYSQMSDNEEDEGTEKTDGGGGVSSSGTSASGGVVSGGSVGLTRNTNAEEVHKAEREKRERAKLESQKKKEKDKEDREKQKQLQQEKKEKRKTQKGERRR
ncbi:coiled-coil domain-containing protein 43 isoform X2 [Ischnura elegans]|nr:coiled-coil domain-containing protein 43 isoform X2 [Ischnura elegans]